ncbi:MAG: hypothetical protein M3T56_02085 [Chloroflexota bacterium]|nr:hypothetical protein [Chloroflexota bacterium]
MDISKLSNAELRAILTRNLAEGDNYSRGLLREQLEAEERNERPAIMSEETLAFRRILDRFGKRSEKAGHLHHSGKVRSDLGDDGIRIYELWWEKGDHEPLSSIQVQAAFVAGIHAGSVAVARQWFKKSADSMFAYYALGGRSPDWIELNSKKRNGKEPA